MRPLRPGQSRACVVFLGHRIRGLELRAKEQSLLGAGCSCASDHVSSWLEACPSSLSPALPPPVLTWLAPLHWLSPWEWGTNRQGEGEKILEMETMVMMVWPSGGKEQKLLALNPHSLCPGTSGTSRKGKGTGSMWCCAVRRAVGGTEGEAQLEEEIHPMARQSPVGRPGHGSDLAEAFWGKEQLSSVLRIW